MAYFHPCTTLAYSSFLVITLVFVPMAQAQQNNEVFLNYDDLNTLEEPLSFPVANHSHRIGYGRCTGQAEH